MTPLQQTGFPDLQLLTRCSAKDFLWLYPPAIQLPSLSSLTTSYYTLDEAHSDAPTTSEPATLPRHAFTGHAPPPGSPCVLRPN